MNSRSRGTGIQELGGGDPGTQFADGVPGWLGHLLIWRDSAVILGSYFADLFSDAASCKNTTLVSEVLVLVCVREDYCLWKN